MPTYLCHGFRWYRRSIRVYVVVQNLDDAAPEWIIPAKSSRSVLESFYTLFDFLPYCKPPPPPHRDSHAGSPSLLRQPLSAATSDDDSYVFDTPAYAHGPATAAAAYGLAKTRSASRPRSRRSSNDMRAQDWSVVKLLEEYDPLNLDEVSRPYAYVADYLVRVDLSVSIVEEMQRYEERVRADRDTPAMTGPRSDETAQAAAV
ncbi:hypothetical protein P8C59_004790 [Phyllachora maydis]|uniref:Uncharacterized protein n=1 Tax=Phyllachora maydis TaxID=1825666 RepID=A0AAD9I345_9PEZI|nr:hypothetical protein P8C59_004790 [Phyllachora maydis]